jgi:regulator of PEP synthase PpsR (kinase-PPPase family)
VKKRPKNQPDSAVASTCGGPLRVHVISDSTGNLAHHILAALVTQFPAGAFHPRFWTFIRTAEQLERTLKTVIEEGGVIMHAVVSDQAKDRIGEFCRQKRVPCKDLTGGFVEFLVEASGLTPAADPEQIHRVDEAYHRRIRAVEFTLEHDDGLGLGTIGDADVVLCGVSRTSKTPTSIYLAQQGHRVANVALAQGVDPPAELLSLPKGKVVGLVIDPHRLLEIRRRRQADWSMAKTRYDDEQAVIEEIKWSRRLFAKQGWPVIDVTSNAIEETAARVLGLLNLPRG